MTATWKICILLQLLALSTQTFASDTPRKEKMLFDFLLPREAVPSLQRNHPKRPSQQLNSPIYYIRMPPIPYSYIPGMGYVSQMPSMNPSVVNLPLPFFGNGKPVNIYQWSGAFDGFGAQTQTHATVSRPTKPEIAQENLQDSPIHHIPGKFTFNGKPNDLYLLRDSYNNLYDDALQNLYP